MEPMNVLAIDTSSSCLKVALSIEQREYFVNLKEEYNHIRNLLPCIQSCFDNVDEDKSKLQYIGVCTGPGSFTGLRIGISSALGIAFASNLLCFGFSVFDVYQFLLREQKDSIIIPIIDAKKQRFYCAFIEDKKPIEMYDIDLSKIRQIINELKSNNKKIVFVGDDFRLIKEDLSNEFSYIEKYSDAYSAKDILSYAKWFLSTKKQIISPEPIYLRKSEAEISMLKKKGIV